MPAARSFLSFSGAALLLPSLAWAAADATAICKGQTQYACTAAGCEHIDPATENELAIAPGGHKIAFCLGSACWKTAWQHLDRSARDRLSLAYTGSASLNGQPAQIQLSASIELKTLTYRLVIDSGEDAPVDILFGSCTCGDGEAGGRACRRALAR